MVAGDSERHVGQIRPGRSAGYGGFCRTCDEQVVDESAPAYGSNLTLCALIWSATRVG
jgi:hypothetical protein